MKIKITQVYEYKFKPTDTLRVLLGFNQMYKEEGTEIELENKGGELYAKRYASD